MTRFDGEPLLVQGMDNNKNKPKGFWATVVRLYRGSTVWRGSVDMVLIGGLVMILCLGFPDLKNFSLFKGDQGQHAGVPVAKQAREEIPTFKPLGAANTQDEIIPNDYVPAHYTIEHDSKNQNMLLIKIKNNESFLVMWPGEISSLDQRNIDKLMANDSEAGRTNIMKTLTRQSDYFRDKKMLKMNTINALITDDSSSIFYLEKAAILLKHPQAQYRMCLFVKREYKNIDEELWERYKPRDNKNNSLDKYRPLEYCDLAKANPLNSSGFADYEIGLRYELGDLLNQDQQKAIQMYQIAADKGYLPAKTKLGALYMSDANSTSQSVFWTEDAAHSGDPEAQYNLAEMYKKGMVTGSPEYEGFIEWADRAAKQGNTKAMIALGNIYRSGDSDFTPNPQRAADYYWKAAMKKDPEGQYLLAQMYESGEGVREDRIQAYVHYSQSFHQGKYEPAKSALDTLASKMSAGELDHAESIFQNLKD